MPPQREALARRLAQALPQPARPSPEWSSSRLPPWPPAWNDGGAQSAAQARPQIGRARRLAPAAAGEVRREQKERRRPAPPAAESPTAAEFQPPVPEQPPAVSPSPGSVSA